MHDPRSSSGAGQLSDYRFDLPEELIAQRPADRREDARMLLVRRNPQGGSPRFEDLLVRDLPEVALSENLVSETVWLRNTSRVFPARFYATRASGGQHEIVLLERVGDQRWAAIVRRSKRLRYPQRLRVYGSEDDEIVIHEGPVVEFPFLHQEQVFALLDRVGEMPLPPYIQVRSHSEDRERYQTVWADPSRVGSAAAPTASLHFGQDLIDNLLARGVHFADVVLHVGLGTFESLRCERVDDNTLHRESFFVARDMWSLIHGARKRVCLGTTALRTLQSLPGFCSQEPHVERWLTPEGDFSGRTRIFIRPGYEFNGVDALLTNFHLPESSLFILVSAFAGSIALAKEAYAHAISKRYRFFSYGDATLWV